MTSGNASWNCQHDSITTLWCCWCNISENILNQACIAFKKGDTFWITGWCKEWQWRKGRNTEEANCSLSCLLDQFGANISSCILEFNEIIILGVLLNQGCVLSIHPCFSAPATSSGSFIQAYILQLGKKALGNHLPRGSIFVQAFRVSLLSVYQSLFILFSHQAHI